MPYFDYAATTPCDPEVLEVHRRFAAEALNSSSIHRAGQRARRLLEEARERLAAAIGLRDPSQLIFTSGATEAANLAIRGLVARGPRPLRVASSALEHSCVRDTLQQLRSNKLIDLTAIGVSEAGLATVTQENTALIHLLCLMHSNNETGVVQDVARARELRGDGRFLWLCDASQSLGKWPLDLEELGADLVVLSGHKVYAPVGIGCLAGPGLRQLVPQITGGTQEDERRAGTQSVALAQAFAHAAELATAGLAARQQHLRQLEARLLEFLRGRGIAFQINGDGERLPGILNLSFTGFEAADMVIALDQLGMQTSPGSACSTGVVAVSPVLEAMYGGDSARAAGGVRISFGKDTTPAEVDDLARAIATITGKN